ncbi:hypothetical protein AH2_00019 [Burkholderia phage vB_BceS_AH2]|uniref:Uncharacterized protein n=1 Tax=Burkholderia phage vB_BceS_AH2 TaxID=1133022 RepID=I6NTL2_9CAUD|nr:hypothetical protein B613_gp19 [Burkholderia phage vB_BceS_AH2]AEY69529.1 hypothetical protein AH2_00019 [Burkholderia phage vB_BceS_AH2]
MSRIQRIELLRAACAEAESWLGQVETELKALYPKKMRVEVRLSRLQHNWSPARVEEVIVKADGPHVTARVRVMLMRANAVPREVEIDNIRAMVD